MPDKKPIAEQFGIHNFYKPNKDHANRYVWKRIPARILKKKGKNYETKVFELEKHRDVARDHERAREELKRYVFKLRALGREV